ncbi:MAG: SGNH/GDSL hydrolase family protein [Pseudomonadota bacterium]|nr:SGNH/GDSL hydrolase family protein [Pseudomonadota bacterium]
MTACRALLGAACAALAFGAWQAGTRLLPEADPARWTLGAGSVPMEVAQLSGALRPKPGVLDLSFYRVASPRLAAFQDGVIELVARVPTDGQLFVRLGADTVSGPTQPVQGPPPGGGGGRGMAPGPGAALAGGAAMGPPPGGSNGGPGRPTVGGSRPGGVGQERGVGLLVDRSAGGGLRGRKLECTDAPAPASERFTLRLEARGADLSVSVDGAPATRCHGQWSPGAVVFGSGVRRVQIESVTVTPAGGAAFTDTFGGPLESPWLGALLTALGGAAGFAAGGRLGRVRAVALAATPLLALPLLGAVDLRGVLDGLRLLALPEAWGPLLFAGVPALAALVLVAGAAAASWRRAVLYGLVPVGIVGVGVLVGAVSGAGFSTSAAGVTLLATLGVPWAALAWVNSHPVARRVALSYALLAALLVGAEAGLRFTNLDDAWTRTAGWKRASEEFAELLEIRRYRAYPDEGFPVRPPDADPTRRRIVALGGSSTGGAFQMDDLDQFWPRKLETLLAGTDWEVVNQGVGGWNTLHMRLYVESQIDRLDADLYVLYVGHNDILSPSAVPYSQLYAQWRTPSAALVRVSDALNALRLYVGFKHALFAMRGSGSGVAVPVADARENIEAIVAAAAAKNAHVLLVTEGLNPDPLPMRDYGEMLATVAQSTGNAYLDGAEALRAAGDPELFLDDCHLSAEGHVTLAGWVKEALTRRGWLGR